MRTIPEQQDPAVGAHPGRQRISVHELPVYEVAVGRLVDDARAHRVPVLERLAHLTQLPRKTPRLLDVVLVRVRQYPAAVGAVLDGAEQEVHLRPDPTVERVTVV